MKRILLGVVGLHFLVLAPSAFAAIAFRAVGTVATANQAASLAPGLPAGTVPTDVLVCKISINGSGRTITPPAGWTLMNRTNNGTTISGAMYWALGSVASTTFTLSAGSTAVGLIEGYSGVNNTTPLDVATAGQSNASSTNITAPSITTVTAGAMLVQCGAISNTNTTATILSAFSGGTESAEGVATAAGTTRIHGHGCRQLQAAAGATGTKVATSTVAGLNVGVLGALRPNLPPDQLPIGAKSVNEGVLLSFVVTASDPDGTIPTMSTSTLPTGATYTLGSGTATLSWTPNFTQSGSYPVTFRATDGFLTDSEIVTITVNNVNQPPDQATIGAKSVNENVLLSFVVTATDPDGTIPTMSTSTLPTGATYTLGSGTATFNWTPTFLQSGSYPVTFRSTDGALTDSEIVTITVNNVNAPPDQATIGAKSVNENVLLSFVVTATDPDGTIPTMSTSTLPTGATYTLGSGTATFSWTPTFLQSGSYPVTFRSTDGALTDSEIVTITVNNVNAPPDQATIGAKSVNENVLLSFVVTATDPDGTIPTMSTSTLPTGATYTLGSGTATFNWTPNFTQAGSYPVTFRSTDGSLTDSEIVTITVNNVNRVPDQLPIGAKSTNENVLLTFVVTATDPDGTIPTMSTSTLPTGATYTLGSGTATFNWTPNFTQAGSYPVTFRSTDGALTDSEIVTITVNNVNRVPDQLPIGAKSVNENVLLTFVVTATDPDGTIPTMSTSTLPTGATYTLGSGTATFSWTPNFTQAGSYPVTFRSTDGALTDSEIVTITVNNVNRVPDQLPIGAKSVNENVLLTFVVTATDPDGTIPTMSSTTLPTGATYTLGSGTATFSWTPTFSQSGSYPVTFRATDGSLTDSEIVTITVNNVNRVPDQATIGAKSVNEGVLLSFVVTATDPDGTIPTMSSTTLPTGATYTLGSGTATFNWTPNFTQAGSYPVTFRSTDGSLTDSEIVTITVNNVPQPPVLAVIGPKSVNEGVLLTFNISATDADGTLPTFTSSTLPTGATLTGNGNGTATFTWTPRKTWDARNG